MENDLPSDEPVDKITLGEVFRAVSKMERTLEILTSQMPQSYVTTNVWKQRNDTVDREFTHKGEEISDLKAEITALKALNEKRPDRVIAVLASIFAGISLLFTVVRPLFGPIVGN